VVPVAVFSCRVDFCWCKFPVGKANPDEANGTLGSGLCDEEQDLSCDGNRVIVASWQMAGSVLEHLGGVQLSQFGG